MRISRREFLKYCTIAAGALGLTTTDLLKIEDAFAKIGNGGPHVVWLPGQACTGCTMSLANSIKETDVASLLLFDIDLDYNEQLCAAAGALAVGAAVSAIGKTTVLAIEGAIPSAATGGDENFCTIWTRTGGILAAGSGVAAVPSAAANGILVGAAPIALGFNDVIGAGSELVAGTTLPAATIVANAADRAAMTALGASFTSAGGSSYGTDRTNANIILLNPMTVAVTVEITGGTDMGNSNGQTLTQGSVLAVNTALAAGTLAASSFDRLWLSEVDTLGNPVNTNVAATWTYAGPGNEWSLDAPGVTMTSGSRAVSGPMVVGTGSILAVGTDLKAGTRVPDVATDQAFLITDSSIATLFDGYGSTASADVLAAAFSLVALQEIVLKGTATLPPLAVGQFGATADADKTMLHECNLFGSSAAAILCVGTCSSFGGIPAALGNRTGASGALYKGLTKAGKYNGVLQQYAAKIINIGGCPPHSDWIVGTIAYILATNLQLPAVEGYGRPMAYYGQYQCNAGPCEWRYNQGYNAADEVNPPYANPKVDPVLNANINSSLLYKNKWGNDPISNVRYTGCIGVVGCKGRKTKADCSLRRWNADFTNGYGTNWCVGSGAGCHGCTEPTFPDKVGKFFNFA
jgi:Ni,Fe-hydrogenase I small subunit